MRALQAAAPEQGWVRMCLHELAEAVVMLARQIKQITIAPSPHFIIRILHPLQPTKHARSASNLMSGSQPSVLRRRKKRPRCGTRATAHAHGPWPNNAEFPLLKVLLPCPLQNHSPGSAPVPMTANPASRPIVGPSIDIGCASAQLAHRRWVMACGGRVTR